MLRFTAEEGIPVFTAAAFTVVFPLYLVHPPPRLWLQPLAIQRLCQPSLTAHHYGSTIAMHSTLS